MKKKLLTFLLAICFMLPCAFFLTACGETPPDQPVFNGYNIFIKNEQTDTFECVYGQSAIRAGDIRIVSDWSDETKNVNHSISNFEVSVEWYDENNTKQTRFPNFWTNSSGSTNDDLATTYEFTLTSKEDNAYTLKFTVNITPILVDNCRIRIFDGDEYKYSTEMIWGHNDRETDTSKHFKFDIENLDAEYNKEKHIQWAMIEKETYDALETPEQKKEFLKTSEKFSQTQLYNHTPPGTYYIFAYVPKCNNKIYGEDGDGRIYEYATLTILPIELQQEKDDNRVLQHDDSQYKNNFRYVEIAFNEEIEALDEEHSNQIECLPYVFEDGIWKVTEMLEIIDEPDNFDIIYKNIQVHAVKVANEYKMVDLKDLSSNLTEWVFINADGTQGDVVPDNSAIELVDYSEIAEYINGTSIKIPLYYKVKDMSEQNIYYDCSKVFKTEVTIKKFTNILAPTVEVGKGGVVASQYVTSSNTFEFIYGEKYKLTWADDILNSPEEIMNYIIVWSSHYSKSGFDQTEYSEDPYYGYVTLESHNYAWKLDGANYTSEPLKITYYINKKAEIEKPEYKSAVGNTDYFVNPIEVDYDSTCNSYNLDNYITIDNVVNEDISFELDWVNVYSYKLADGDEFLSQDDLISKIRQQGTNVGYNGNFTAENDNIIGKTFVIMYDLTNTRSTIWKGETTAPILFKITIVNA